MQKSGRRRRRWWWLVVVSLFLLAIAWGGREWAYHRAEFAYRSRDFVGAEQWLPWAMFGPKVRWEAYRLELRLDRKLSRVDEFRRGLKEAARHGIPREKAELEMLLALAQSGDLAEIEPRLGELLVQQNDEAAEICDAYVSGSLLNYRFKECETLLGMWQSDFPADPQPHFWNGRIAEHANNYDVAEKEFAEAIRLQPRHVAAVYNLGRLKVIQQKPEDAYFLYEKCVALLPHPQPGWLGMGRCQRLRGNLEAARESLERALVDSDRPVVIATYRMLGDPEDAARSQAVCEMGQLEIDCRNYEQAVVWLQKATEANARDWKVRHGYATALRLTGRSEDAAREAEIVEREKKAWQTIDRLFDELRADSQSAALRTEIGKAFLEHLSARQGIIWLNSALYFDPKFGPAHEALADYYEAHRDEDASFTEMATRHREAGRQHPVEKGS